MARAKDRVSEMTADEQRRVWREAKRRERIRKGLAIAELPTDAKLPAPPDRVTLLKALGVRAREGSVPAMRLLLEEYRRDGEQLSSDSTIDELARRARCGADGA